MTKTSKRRLFTITNINNPENKVTNQLQNIIHRKLMHLKLIQSAVNTLVNQILQYGI
jgi:ferritin